MGDFITALLGVFNIESLWNGLTAAAPLAGTLIVFGFGYRVVRKLMGGASKGKTKV